jgi:hypothetical protein
VKVAAVAVVVALAAKAAVVRVVVKLDPKAAQVARATVHLPHVVVALRKVAQGVIVKIDLKEVLRVRHPIVSTIAAIVAMTDRMTEAWTAAMTVVRAAMSCHVTLIPS